MRVKNKRARHKRGEGGKKGGVGVSEEGNLQKTLSRANFFFSTDFYVKD